MNGTVSMKIQQTTKILVHKNFRLCSRQLEHEHRKCKITNTERLVDVVVDAKGLLRDLTKNSSYISHQFHTHSYISDI